MHKKELSKKKIIILASVITLLTVIIASCSGDKEPTITNPVGVYKLKQLSYTIDASERMIKAEEKACKINKVKGCEDRVEKNKEMYEAIIKKEKKEIYEKFGDK